MICRVCKKEIDAPVCYFCGEDNSAWINREDSAPEKTVDAELEPEAISDDLEHGHTRHVRKYKIDKKKLIRLLAIIIAVILVIILLSSLFGSEEDSSSGVEDGLFVGGMLLVRNGNEWGYISINDASKYAISPQFKYSTQFKDGIAFAYIGDKYAVVDTEGKLLTDPAFDAVGSVSEEGLFAVKTEGMWGYIDKNTMEYAIDPKFSTAGVFEEGVATVSVKGLYGYIGTDGEYIIPPQYEFALSFSEGYAAISADGKWGYISKDGEARINPDFDEAQRFINGFAIVKHCGSYGLIDTLGSFVIPAQFDSMVYDEGCSMYKVRIGDKYGYVNKNGEYKINPQFCSLGDFGSESMTYAARGDGKYGFIDLSGDFVIEARYEDAGEFCMGLAPVKNDGLWGYIDTDGEFVINPCYDEASHFYSDGYALCRDENGKCVVIDKEGINILDAQIIIDEAFIK